MAGLTDDSDAERFAYLAEGNAKQARKRVAADVLITDETGRVLLVDPTYKEGWDLPGGMVEANEPPRAAAERELREELDLELAVGRLLHLSWIPPHGPWDDTLMFLFDGGTLDERQVAALRVTDEELRQFKFVSAGEARTMLSPHLGAQLEAALASLTKGTMFYDE
ncbi:NUDIX domain-containing protein [Amycolatopsis sp. cg5]|uniref:NUDIX domain-containing protein n=1 Tax=Amycolatopsis sp. cg5 TaxID=3238802 RepID=UPI0035262F94